MASSLAELAATYAPTNVLHGDDKLRPSSADWFVERSELRWASGRRLDGVKVENADGEVDADALGAAASSPYRHNGYVASALTRPLDSHPARPDALPLEQGFFLRLREDSFYRGPKSGARAYWDYDEPTSSITYWLFYPASSPPLGILRAGEQLGTEGPATEEVPETLEAADAAAKLEEFHRAYPTLAAQTEPPDEALVGDVIDRLKVVGEGVRALLRKDDVLHEGDWERVTLYLDADDPTGAPPAGVALYRHSTQTIETWDRVEREDTHPVAYSAIGSHATLPSPDFGFIDVGDRDGPRWETAKGLRVVEEQPWFGFGGAWGRVGKVRDSTGPLGPGAHWKHPAPRPERFGRVRAAGGA